MEVLIFLKSYSIKKRKTSFRGSSDVQRELEVDVFNAMENGGSFPQ
jgi:hypothetical protein